MSIKNLFYILSGKKARDRAALDNFLRIEYPREYEARRNYFLAPQYSDIWPTYLQEKNK